MKKELDKSISALVLVGLAVIWLIYFIVAEVNPDLAYGIGIAKNVMLGLTYIVLLYNAWGWSKNILVRVIFLAIVAFLIFCIVAQYVPTLEIGKIPTIALNFGF